MIKIFLDNNIISICIDIMEYILPNNHYIYEKYQNINIIKIKLYNNN